MGFMTMKNHHLGDNIFPTTLSKSKWKSFPFFWNKTRLVVGYPVLLGNMLMCVFVCVFSGKIFFEVEDFEVKSKIVVS